MEGNRCFIGRRDPRPVLAHSAYRGYSEFGHLEHAEFHIDVCTLRANPGAVASPVGRAWAFTCARPVPVPSAVTRLPG
ncbi:MAG: hypothetical protein JWM93_31 [Frankiales bacterium]|nr:hypothetical protein [Frankiales bacterium]